MAGPVLNYGGANQQGLHALQPIVAVALVLIFPEGKLVSSPVRSGLPLDRGPCYPSAKQPGRRQPPSHTTTMGTAACPPPFLSPHCPNSPSPMPGSRSHATPAILVQSGQHGQLLVPLLSRLLLLTLPLPIRRLRVGLLSNNNSNSFLTPSSLGTPSRMPRSRFRTFPGRAFLNG